MCTRDRVNNAGIIRTGCKVTLAAIYLRRDRVVGVVPAVGIPWLRGGRAPASFSRCYAACACGTKTRRGPPAALPGQTCGGMLGAMANIFAAGARPRNFKPLLRPCACGTKTRRRPPAALPGADVWGHAGAMVRIAACTTRVPPPAPGRAAGSPRLVFVPQAQAA